MRYAIAIVLSLFLAGTVLANQCPTLVHKIDEQLAAHEVDSGAKAQIMTLRNQGEALHQQGKHAESVKVLNEALDKLKTATQ